MYNSRSIAATTSELNITCVECDLCFYVNNNYFGIQIARPVAQGLTIKMVPGTRKSL